jgi:Zn-dependent M16 (insulinase) family peptidase
MKLKKGAVVNGFTVTDQRAVREVNSEAWSFEHKKSGAKVIYLANDDDNTVFSISFRTPPADSTGLPHILEHSVLCGSRKFPSKEPFVELVKGSLNTFLNAMTFPDKTMYPVASRNPKDFRNLMDVYLDAVFHPNLYNQPEIMMQEGWHYELESKDKEITYKGVVYNEMKGALSSPDALLQRRVRAVLFPDTPYGFESGGDPEDIPQLTQEQFVAFHERYYHPSNSYIFLYGDLDIADTLEFIDNYLDDYDDVNCDSAIQRQKPFARTVEKELEYPVSSTEKLEDKTFYSLCFVAGDATNPEHYLGLQILEHLLLETPAAPLKQALIDAGVCKDASGILVESILQPMIGVRISGSNPDQKDRFVKTVYQTLEKLVHEGIDKKLIESSINVFEFQLREANYEGLPKGLVYNMKVMDSWLYDGDPLVHLAYEPVLTKIKTALTGRYFEDLIEHMLMDNTHRALVMLKPRNGLEEERTANLRKELAEFKSGLSDTELSKLVRRTKELAKRQQTPDSPEVLAKIPLLAIEDIEPLVESLPLQEKNENGAKILLHPQFTNRIAYVNFYFDVSTVPQELLPYLFLLARILGKVSAGQLSYSELSNEINIHTGGVQFDVSAFSLSNTDEQFAPKLLVEAKALVEKLPQMFELVSKIINKSCYDDEKRLKEVVQETTATWENSITGYGQAFVSNRVLGYFSPVARYTEHGMLDFYHFVADLEKDFPSKAKEISAKLREVAELIFAKNNLLTSVALEEENYPAFQAAFPQFFADLSRRNDKSVQYQFALSRDNEGLITSGKVQVVAKAANYRRLGYTYHGSMKVLETILRYDYLWSQVRVKGGAYGGSAKFERNGNLVFFSYRDPNLAETLAVYDEMADFLKNYDAGEREMIKYIIGTIGRLDVPLTPSMKAQRAAEQYIRGLSQADRQKERNQILDAKPDDIRELAKLVAAAMHENYLCVLGNEEKIRQNKAVFGKLVQVFE